MNDSKHYQKHNPKKQNMIKKENNTNHSSSPEWFQNITKNTIKKNLSTKTLNVDANLWNCRHQNIENKKTLQYGICNYNTSQNWKNRIIIVSQK